MTPQDLRMLCAALGFVAVAMREGKRSNRDLAHRAAEVSRLIESYCLAAVPETTGSRPPGTTVPPDETSVLLERYVTELRATGSADLSHDRATLLGMYELLLVQKTRRGQRAFYETAPDDMIASCVANLAEQRLREEET